MFRNVRTEPRRFQFRSRHLPDLDPKWAERKERIEAEVAGEQDPDAAPARPIRFRSSRTKAETAEGARNGRNGAKRRSSERGTPCFAPWSSRPDWSGWRGVAWCGWRPVIFRMY